MRTSLQAFAATAAAAAALFSGAAQAEMASYAIDPSHTFATFEISHFGASVNRGRFDKKEGTVQFDRAGKSGKVDVRFDTSSINSGTPAFDKHLKSADLFNTEQHPTMRFVSDKFVFDGDKVSAVEGQLTLLGKTHPVTLKANQFACYPNPMAKTEACGGDFEAVIDRTLWGMNFATDFGMPKQVKITATIEAFKR